mgnify:CR=1 FL=1
MKLNDRTFLIPSIVLILLAILPNFLSANKPVMSDTETILRIIADTVIKETPFQFLNIKDDRRYATAAEAPADAQLKLPGRYNDWRYWNGVLNLAMIRLSETLSVPAYREFAARNVAFNFDNYRFFEDRHTTENKWEYPFGQFFMMEELDDCGAMGASVVEVARDDPQSRYRDYLKLAAQHILIHQPRLEDGTLVRSFPRKWTLWADDLYMSIAFLARMNELPDCLPAAEGIDDAARQVINFHK